MLIFRLDTGQISITITASRGLINKTEGLMGLFDENQDNDLKVRDGPILSAESNSEVIFSVFGESCKCTKYKRIYMHYNIMVTQITNYKKLHCTMHIYK